MIRPNKMKPTNLNVGLGVIEAAQERRAAYERAAQADGMTLSAWARKRLDEAANFQFVNLKGDQND